MPPSAGSRPWDVALMSLLVGSVALVFWHESSEDAALRRTLVLVDAGLCALFLVEWAWRGVRSGEPGRWGLRHSWELLGMVPLLAPLPGFLRVLRLLRFARILRVFGRVGERVGVWERIAAESHIGKIALASATVTLVGAGLVWALERDDPRTHIADFETALWWAIVTVTTVGYGDVTPVTAPGRFVAAGLMVAGIGTIGLLASSLASVLVTKKEGAPSAPPAMGGALTKDLVALAELHREGRLTDDEYAQAKRRLLGP